MLATLIVFASLFAMIAFWCLVTFIIALASGWRALAHRFPAPGKPPGQSFPMQRANINSAQYNNCLSVVVADAGLYLAVWRIFPGHAPILIPWSELAPFKQRKMMWVKQWETRVKLTTGRTITFAFWNTRLVEAMERKRTSSPLAPNAWSSSSQPPIPSPFISGPS